MPPSGKEEKTKRRRWLGALRLVLGLGFSVGLGWLAVREVALGTVLEAFRGFHPGWGLLSLAIFLLASLLRTYRWQLLFVNQRVSLRRLFLVQNAGIGLNNVTPVRVLSEATQFAILRLRDRLDSGAILAALGMERLLDLFAVGFIMLVGLALMPTLRSVGFYVIGLVMLAAGITVVLLFLIHRRRQVGLVRRFQLLGSLLDALAALERSPRRVGFSLITSIAYWMMVGFTAWIVAEGMQLGISFIAVTVAILGTVFLSASIPSLPGAAGTFEFAVVYLLGLTGSEPELALSFALIMHFILFAPPVVIALVVLPREGTGSISQLWRVPRQAYETSSESRGGTVPTTATKGYNVSHLDDDA